jgi:hypothetical protein
VNRFAVAGAHDHAGTLEVRQLREDIAASNDDGDLALLDFIDPQVKPRALIGSMEHGCPEDKNTK